MPKFSILIPIIKGEFLSTAIDSVLSQDYSDWELILYNDCSPDDICSLVKKYSDSRIRYFKGEKNLGAADPSITWNKLLSLAKGEYVCLLGDDDFISQNFLKDVDVLISKYPDHKIFRTKLKRVDEKGNVIYNGVELPEVEDLLASIYERVVNKRIQSAGEFVLQRNALNEIGGYVNFPRACGSDDATFFSLAKTAGIVSTNKAVAFWRKSVLNISDNDKEEINNYKLRIFLEWERDFLDGLFSSRVSLDEIYKSINDQIDQIDRYKVKDEVENIGERGKFIKMCRHFIIRFWRALINGPLRQPARKIWYFICNKKLEK